MYKGGTLGSLKQIICPVCIKDICRSQMWPSFFPVMQDAEAMAKAMASAAVKVKCDGKVTRKGALCLILVLPPLVK